MHATAVASVEKLGRLALAVDAAQTYETSDMRNVSRPQLGGER